MGPFPIQLTYPTTNPVAQPQRASSYPAMNHLATVHSTPLDYARTSKVADHTSTKKSKSGTSFSLKDKLRSLRRKSTPSPSTTHHVKLEGLTSDRQVGGTRELPTHQIRRVEADSTSAGPTQNPPQQTGEVVYASAFGNVRSGWLQHPTSVSFRR